MIATVKFWLAAVIVLAQLKGLVAYSAQCVLPCVLVFHRGLHHLIGHTFAIIIVSLSHVSTKGRSYERSNTIIKTHRVGDG